MTYRDDLAAERSRREALEERAADLARENAELHAKLDAPPHPPEMAAPAAPEPPRVASKSRASFLGALAVAGGIAFMAAMLSNGVVSASLKLAAPIVCSKGYDRSVVVLHVGGTSKGGTSYRADLWCVFPDKSRFPERVDDFAVLGTLFGEYLLALGAVAVSFVALRRRAGV